MGRGQKARIHSAHLTFAPDNNYSTIQSFECTEGKDNGVIANYEVRPLVT